MISSFTLENNAIADKVILPDYNVLKKALETVRAVNHDMRRRILLLLKDRKKLTVSEVYANLRLEQAIASQHLAVLRKAGVVNTERDGKFIFYSLNKERMTEINMLLENLGG